MMGLKELRKELSEMKESMDKLTEELHQTNITIRESLELTSNTIKDMTESFTKSLKEAIDKMSDMSIQMNVKDTILKNFGIPDLVQEFFKKKKT